jgi:GNAT superfamily N-acetyltransferase
MPTTELLIRRAVASDLPALDPIELAQARDDAHQGELLRSMFAADSIWDVFVAELDARVVGFCAVRLDPERQLGEIGLNAVAPEHASRGVGTALYERALEHMRVAGMKVATVSTGGDPAHAPARRAYEKAGFHASIPSVWMCRPL